MGVTGRFVRTPHRRCDDAPAPATCVAPDRTPATASAAGRRYASSTPSARSRRRLKAAHTRCHSPRTVASPRSMQRRKPIACLLSACRRKTCGTRARPNGAAGRRRPRLPAPPSRVTLVARGRPEPAADHPSSAERRGERDASVADGGHAGRPRARLSGSEIGAAGTGRPIVGLLVVNAGREARTPTGGDPQRILRTRPTATRDHARLLVLADVGLRCDHARAGRRRVSSIRGHVRGHGAPRELAGQPRPAHCALRRYGGPAGW